MRRVLCWRVVVWSALALLSSGGLHCALLHEEVLNSSLGEPVISSSFADVAGPADLPEDFGQGKNFEPLDTLPRDAQGAYVLRPGFFTLEAHSFCLHAGTRGPSRGEGYLWAPLKGAGAPLIQALLRASGRNPSIPQRDVQLLVWAIESRSPITELSPVLQREAAELLTPQELLQVQGNILEALAPELLDVALARLPPEARDALVLSNRMRQLFISGRATYEEVRQLAVLPALDSVEGAVPRGRWSKHPGGFFIRYLPTDYTRTRVDVYVPTADPMLLDLTEDVAMPANTASQRLGFSGGGGTSGGGGSSASYGDDDGAASAQKKPIECSALPSSYQYTNVKDALREVEKRLNLPAGSAYAAEAPDANTGPCAKGQGVKVGKHIAVRMESNDEYIGSIGQCTCVPPEQERFRVINP